MSTKKSDDDDVKRHLADGAAGDLKHPELRAPTDQAPGGPAADKREQVDGADDKDAKDSQE